MAVRAAGCLLSLITLGTPLSLPAEGPKLDSTQTLRSFRFIATGGNGQPVTDLRPEEIQVTDEGKRHPLVYARLLPAVYGAVTPRPGEFSNRATDVGSPSELILLDLLNANITERGAAWNETIRALENQESPDNIFVFLITPDGKLYPVHAWPGGGPASDDTPKPWTKQIRPLLDKALRVVEGIKPTDLTAAPGLTVGPTYQALTTMGQQYAVLPGQKRIIWVTHGTPLSVPSATGPYDFTPQLKQVAVALNQLGILLYTVHQQDRSTSGADSGETLQLLPPLTGGRWFENDSIGPALTQAQVDARGTYQAGYYTPLKEADGKLHKLRISSTRKGVKVLAQQEYLAAPPEDVAKAKFDLAASRPFDTPDIGLRASFAAAGTKTRFEIRIDPRDLTLQHGSSYTGAFSLTFLYLNSDSSQSLSASTLTNVSLTQEQFDAAIKDGYRVTSEQAIPGRSLKVRLLVQDTASNTTGSLTIPIAAQN